MGENTHWSECVCGAKANEEVHAFVTKHDENAHWTECSCGYATAEIAHTYAYGNDGDGHWQRCDCGFIGATVAHGYQTEYSADGHWTECACGAKTEEQAHTLESKQDGDSHWTECVCDYATEKVAHSYGEWQADKNDHWKECTCGKKTEESEHVENEQDKCETCGKVMEDLFTRVDGEGNPSATGGYILFGSYPQSEVTDSTVTTTLTESAGTLPTDESDGKWTSYQYYIKDSKETDYAWYQDITYSGEMYRGVYFTSYRPYKTGENFTSSYQADNGYVKGAVYWFKYEPIQWQILKEEAGSAVVVCEMLIDSQAFHNVDAGSANSYKSSSIREWLNESFYQTAFDELQQEIIATITVDNSAETTGNDSDRYVCDNTEDKVWLLSYQEATTYYTTNEQRQKLATAYARCQGVGMYAVEGNADCANWWLRSPSTYQSDYAKYIHYDGKLNYRNYVYYTYFGVCPAMEIKLA